MKCNQPWRRKARVIPIVSVAYLLGFAPFHGVTQEPDTSGYWDLSLEDLQQITLTTSTRTVQTPADAPAIVTVITEDEIRQSGATTLREVLQQVSGIDCISKEFQPLTYIGIRGLYSTGSNNKIKIMLNGHTLESAVGDPFFHINTMPLQNIRQIEIIQGPGSALYGSNAFLGVINILTKEVAETLSASILGGSYNTVKPSLAVSGSKRDLKFYLYGDYYFTRGPSLLIESDFATRLYGEAYSSAPGYTTEGSEFFTLQSTLSYKGFFFNGFFQALRSECAVGVALALTDGDDIGSYLGFGEMGYRFKVGRKGEMTLKGYYDHHYYNGLYQFFTSKTTALFSEWYPETPFPSDEGFNGRVQSDLSVLGAELSGQYHIGEAVNLLTGGSLEFLDQYNVRYFTNGNSNGRPLTFDGVTYQPWQYYGFMRDVSDSANWNRDATRTVGALYLQGLVDLKALFSIRRGCHLLKLTLGGRYDLYSDIGSSVSPRIGLVYAPIPPLYFKALFGKAFRAPFFHELFQASTSITYGNTELRPENIWTVEGQAGVHITRNLTASCAFFHTQAYDLILRDLTSQYNNFGEFTSNGVEADVRFRFSKFRYAFLNMTYQNVKNTTHQLIRHSSGATYEQVSYDPGGVPSFVGNLGGNYQFFGWMNVNLALNYTSKRERSEEMKFTEEGLLVYKDTRDPIPGRALVTASLLFRNLHQKILGLEVQATVFNLLNTRYSDPEPQGRVPGDIPQAGRHFMIRLSYAFH